MQKKLFFSKKDPLILLEENKKRIINFANLHEVWWFFNNEIFNNLISKRHNLNFPDGRILSLYLKIKQERGSEITKKILLSKNSRKKKHFFIGLERKDLTKISKITKISKQNLNTYNPPFISGIEFPIDERKKIIRKINKFEPYFIWACIGCPKQTILANQIFKETNAKLFFAVGAATDFLLGKKKESPKIFIKLGIEWLYRLLTDFKYAKKKVLKHLKALKYLKLISLNKE